LVYEIKQDLENPARKQRAAEQLFKKKPRQSSFLKKSRAKNSLLN